MDNIFENVELGPPIEVFQLTANFNKDPHPDKVNLGVGGECPTFVSSSDWNHAESGEAEVRVKVATHLLPAVCCLHKLNCSFPTLSREKTHDNS